VDSERWQQVDAVLQSVLDRAPAEREAFLRNACAGDEALEREIRSLLTQEEQAAGFLENPALEVAAKALARRQNGDIPEAGVSLTGQAISHYQVLEKLGGGGMGVVWKARDTRLDRYVALKVLSAGEMSDPERKRRFIQEARNASALNHPNIITIYDIGQAGPQEHPLDFIAMEFVPGKALNQLIPRKGLRLAEVLQYAIQVADALAAAHAAGIVHRDLKPGNLMVSEPASGYPGCVKVLDFGLAKLIARAGTMSGVIETDQGMIVGTVSYMSPEQAEGRKLDARTDIFSFGAVLYEMITGRRAFGGESVASILSAILRDRPAPAAEIRSGVPRDLDNIVTRCLEKDPNRRYQHAGDLKIDLQQAREELVAGDSAIAPERPARRSAGRRWWLVAMAASIAVSLGAGWWLHNPREAPVPMQLTRLTADAGLSGFAALSRDGRLVAYSSDRGQDGGQDLYVKQVAGGQPIRLTFDGAGNTTPDFSPDASKIVFWSNRDGGGIYEIPSFGGEARPLARDGLNPRFSPDGSQVAYWVGARNVATAVPGAGTVWVAPAAGGQPQRVGANFTAARYPVWAPDGKHLLFVGYTSAKAYESSSLDWWLVATNGSETVQTGAYDALVRAGLRAPGTYTNGPIPGCWLAAGGGVAFSIASGDVANLWEIGISPGTGKVNGVPRRLTTGTGNDTDPSCAPGGALAFTSGEARNEVWTLPLDLNRGTALGALERVTTGPAYREHASLSSDGRVVAFASNQASLRVNIWMRDLQTGKESSVAGSPFALRFPVVGPSGGRIAFSAYERAGRVVYVAAPGGTWEKLCQGCLRATDWSRDEKKLLVFGGDPFQIDVLDLASHRQTPLVKHANCNLLYGRFSPDNRWVSFTVRTEPNRGRIAIAPADGPAPVPESAWITIAPSEAEDWANWSPDGKTLYFTSRRDGHFCLWGQRLDARSRCPVGGPFAVLHLHGRVSYRQRGWSAGGGRIAMVLVEDIGNIWLMSPPALQP